MEFKKGDFVKLLNEKEIYIIDDIKDNEKHETMSKYSNNLEKGSNFVQLYYSLK